MAHFAELDDNNIVLRVIVVSNDNEADGENWCKNLLGGKWKQTSYNNNIRKNYAAIGYTYDATRDAFIPPQPYTSWVLDESTCQWKAPVDYPSDGKIYKWKEGLTWQTGEMKPTGSWKEIIYDETTESYKEVT
tara:strand:- start:1114 stop:1512 length:399 start_codon:yes stop_codon:yes gene_type:complete